MKWDIRKTTWKRNRLQHFSAFTENKHLILIRRQLVIINILSVNYKIYNKYIWIASTLEHFFKPNSDRYFYCNDSVLVFTTKFLILVKQVKHKNRNVQNSSISNNQDKTLPAHTPLKVLILWAAVHKYWEKHTLYQINSLVSLGIFGLNRSTEVLEELKT